MKRPGLTSLSWSALALLALAASPGSAAAEASATKAAAAENGAALPIQELKRLSLDDLANLDVSLAFRAPHRLADTPAPAFVLTREDIRRSGATSIPEALRLVPGLIVSRVGSNQWAIVSRFANSRFSNKFLVLVDGRTVYTPLFGGTFWEVQDTLLEDVEKIEVIRGSGAALWGSNGITGVIHVLTSSSHGTTGNLASVTLGDREPVLGGLRHGGRLRGGGTYRVFARYARRDAFDLVGGGSADDAWNIEQGGFRADWERGRDAFMVEGGAHDLDASRTMFRSVAFPPFNLLESQNDDHGGSHLVVRAKRVVSPREDWTLQLYHDATDLRQVRIRERRQTGDLDLVHRREDRAGSERVSGLGVRVSSDRIRNDSPFLSFTPEERTVSLASAFVQQRWLLNGDRASLVAGARLEQNSFTGLEVNPTLRGTYRLDDRHMVWAAVSRSVRVPSRAADDVRANVLTLPPGALARGAPPAVVTIFGNRDVDSEVLRSLESGWRGTLTRRLSVELALFASSFDGLITFARPDPPVLSGGPPLHLVIPRAAVNGGDANLTGLELSTTWQPDPRWTLHLAYSYLDMRFDTLGVRDRGQEGASPRNQLWLRSQTDLTPRLQLDLFAQYQDEVPTADVPSHVRVDLRLGWRPHADLDVDMIVQNLLEPGHPEFGREFFLGPVNTEIPRSVLARLVRRF